MAVGGNIRSHHMPPDSVSPLDKPDGPAIQMLTSNDYDTPSFGRHLDAPFMQSQSALAQSNFMAAFEKDAAAVKLRFRTGNMIRRQIKRALTHYA